jgi:hypothetical protein
MEPLLVVGHLGALHPVESWALALLTLVPFAVLALVVALASRRDRRAGASAGDGARQATRGDPAAGGAVAGSASTDTAAPQSVQQ